MKKMNLTLVGFFLMEYEIRYVGLLTEEKVSFVIKTKYKGNPWLALKSGFISFIDCQTALDTISGYQSEYNKNNFNIFKENLDYSKIPLNAIRMSIELESIAIVDYVFRYEGSLLEKEVNLVLREKYNGNIWLALKEKFISDIDSEVIKNILTL